MLKRSFQHTVDFLWSVDSWSSKDVYIPNPNHPSNYHFASKSLERPHSPWFAFKTPHFPKLFVVVGETYISFISTGSYMSIRSPRTNCSCHSNFLDFDAHFSAVEYSVAYFPSIFGSTKVRSDLVWNQKTLPLQRDRTPLWIRPSSGANSCLCTTPPSTYTETMAWLWTTRQTCQGGEIGKNVFNSGLMHKLIV